MVKYLSTFLEPWFKTPNCATYKIAFKARNSTHNKRDEIIKSIAGSFTTNAIISERIIVSLKMNSAQSSVQFLVFDHFRSCGDAEPYEQGGFEQP